MWNKEEKQSTIEIDIAELCEQCGEDKFKNVFDGRKKT